MRSMETAPTDGRDILVLAPRGWRRVHYWDCQWLRDEEPDESLMSDCWRDDDGNCIELSEARGWKPAADRDDR